MAPIVWLALLAAPAAAQLPCEVFRIENPIAPVDGHFGSSVALRGGRLLVGMPSKSSPAYGAAYIYDRTQTGWTLAASLSIADGVPGDLYGSAVAIDGDVALIGRRFDGTLNAKGSTYVFLREPSGAWIHTQKITIPDADCWAFGWSIALQGTRAAIAAKGAGSVGPKGRVLVFELEEGVFVQKAKIKPSLDNLSDWFGASLALDGDRLAVGAPKGGTGRAYVFDRQPSGEWVEQALLLPDDLAIFDEYGHAVAVSGDRVAVSALAHDVPWGNGGAVYLFQLGASGWQVADKLTAAPPVLGNFHRFGYALSLTTDELLVGAPSDVFAASAAGAVHVFRRVEDSWFHAGKLYGSSPGMGSWFGNAMARDGDEVAIGASGQTTPTNGRVHMFSFAGGAHLGAPSAGFSLSIGGKQPLQLGACPDHAGDFYVLLGSLSGTTPALPLGEIALPLVPDAYFFLTLNQPGAANFPGSIGVLDPYGRAQAAFTLPAGTLPSSAGLTLHHAYVVLDQHTLAVELASNAVPLVLVP